MGLIVHNVDVPDSGLGDALRTGFVNQNTMNAELYDTVVFKVTGYDLSKNDFTDILLTKLNALDVNAEQNIQSDWNETDTTSDAYILNKPIFASSEILVGADWTGTGLIFDVFADAFPINDGSYGATPAEVTLDAADATLDRIDLIVAIAPTAPDTVGTVGKITGTPASTALVVPPDYDPSTYYVIKPITVRAAATTPDGAENTAIYADSTTWTKVLTANVVENTSDPSEGVNCLEGINWTGVDSMTFAAPAPLSTADLDLLTFDIKLKELKIKKWFSVTIINGTHRLATRIFRSGENNFDSQNLSYQTIRLDKQFLNLNIETFDSIEIKYQTNTTGFYFDNFQLLKGSGSEVPPNTGIPDVPNDGILYGRKDGAWEEITQSDVALETSLPVNGIVIDGLKKYYIESGTIKIADSGHVNGKDIEVLSNPADAAVLKIDLSNFPNSTLQGGGFSESPANIYTLETALADSLLKQHLTLLMWRRGNFYASNSLNYRPNGNPSILSAVNNSDTYVEIEFNVAIIASDLILGNFSRTFTQNGGTATDVTLDSITDGNGDAITVGTKNIRIYFTITGTEDGNEFFTITAASLTDLYTNNSLSVTSSNINLTFSDPIVALTNVIAYWKEGEGDNTTGTATKTDIKNSKVLSASGYSNPTLASGEWTFNGTNQGFAIADSAINALINADAKNYQIHFIGSYLNAASSRITTATNSINTNGNTNFAYKAGTGNIYISYRDAAGDDISQDTGLAISLSTDYLFSLKFYQSGGNKVDLYIDNGTTIVSYLALDLSTINANNLTKLFIGMRNLGSDAFYNVTFKSMVIANSDADFNTIRTELAL